MHSRTVTIDGRTVEIENVQDLPGGGARLRLTAGDRRWRVRVSRSGRLVECESARAGDQLVAAEAPDWIDDALAMLANPMA